MYSTDSQFLFAYGTLRSAHPEHVQCFSEVRSIRSARIPGELWTLAEGYPLLVIQREQCLAEARGNSRGEWIDASHAFAPPSQGLPTGPLIGGELIELEPGDASLEGADRWEGFQPNRATIYRRFISWLWLDDGLPVLGWIYGAFEPPPGAIRFPKNRWPAPSA